MCSTHKHDPATEYSAPTLIPLSLSLDGDNPIIIAPPTLQLRANKNGGNYTNTCTLGTSYYIVYYTGMQEVHVHEWIGSLLANGPVQL